MKLSKLAVVASVTLALSLLTAIPAEARMTPGPIASESSTDAVGLIVKYKPAVNPIAPNGEPTGENYAGVDLENSKDLGGGFKSVDFVNDLDQNEIQTALDRIELDPRVESASLNRVFQAANYVVKPIASSILPGRDPVDLPIVVKTAIRLPKAPVASAVDAWRAPNQLAVKISWKKPTNRISGRLAGYKIQIYAAGAWRTLKSRTSTKTRSYTTASGYLNAGVQSKFRVAAVTYFARRYITGSYRTVYATPTAAPRANTGIQVQNATNEMRFSWAPLTSATDLGGLQVSYRLEVVKNGTETMSCSTSTATTCVISPISAGDRISASLNISNIRGSIMVGPLSATFTLSSQVVSNDEFFNKQWQLMSDIANPYGMKVTNAWLTESGSPDIYVAVLDTGITAHPDLDANIVAGYDMISSPSSAHDLDGRDPNPTDNGDYSTNPAENSSWHGTHVTGIIAAVDNNIGVLGVAPNVKIIPVRVLGSGGGTEADIVAGLNWASGIPIAGIAPNPHPANVINMSIGGQGSCLNGSPTQTALAAIKNLGITVVTASGNDGSNAAQSYPGNCYPTINVAATGKTGKPTFYSNFGDAVDIAAPGGDYCFQIGQTNAEGQIYSTINSGLSAPVNPTYGYELGTSMASPNVAGVVALLYSALLRVSPTITKNTDLVNRMWGALSSTTIPLAASVPPATPSNGTCVSVSASTQNFGVGIVNAEAAVAAILR